MSKVDNILEDIHSIIKWFDENNSSTNVSAISEKLDKFNIYLARFNEIVCDSYELWVELEDKYKTSLAEKIVELANSGKSVAQAEKEAIVALKQEKKDWTTAESGYRRLKSRLERFDKIGDSKKQRVSVVKATDLKNL